MNKYVLHVLGLGLTMLILLGLVTSLLSAPSTVLVGMGIILGTLGLALWCQWLYKALLSPFFTFLEENRSYD